MRTGNSPEGELLVGGQALIEGVMMRSPGAYGVAVRRPDGSIAFQRGKVASLARRYPFLKLPILRGVAVLFQSLALGIRALNFSAEQAMAEPKPEEAKPVEEKKEDKSNWAIAGSMAFGLVLGAVVFLLIPLWLTRLAEQHLFAGHLSTVAFNLVDGALRAAFFLAYIFAISRMKDIHRVFQYHGAEHKVVFAWEKAVPLTVENARAQSRLHPRCGTSFLLFVLLVSILVFSFIPKTLPFLVMYGGRLLLVPVIAGLSYEVLRFTAKHRAAPLFSLLVAPGLALQRITTQEPADDMLEVAIAALEEALREDGLLQDRETPREAADPLAVPLADLPPSMPGAAARA
ncbi:MAG: DUF1385 domain-containing protein [Thermoanaerobaculia bacterium]